MFVKSRDCVVKGYFQQYFNYILAASAPIHAFLEVF